MEIDEFPSKVATIQPSEGRLRFQEQKQAQIRIEVPRNQPKVAVPLKMTKPEAPKISYPKNPFEDENDDFSSKKKNKFNPVEVKNPFDDDDEDLDADNYDKNKNPFED